MNNPKLYLIPTPISEISPFEVLPKETLDVILNLKYFVVEKIRTTRRFLRSVGYIYDFVVVWFYEISKYDKDIDFECISPLKNGNSIGLLSEAGLPCIADPGSLIVGLAQENNFQIVPLGGTSSIYKSLMASGFNGQQFTFHGYLPIKNELLKKELKKIEDNANRGYTQIFIETPYRNQRMIEAILICCSSQTKLCIALNMDSPQQKIIAKSIYEWRKSKINLKGLPCVFLIGK
jgi:16S rRNA (cytidine1402-2'-O)-methyltransferase